MFGLHIHGKRGSVSL